MTNKNTSAYSNIDKSESPEHWVKLMADFANLPDIQFIRRMMVNWIKESEAQIILDAGCGTGDSTREIAASLPSNSDITGLDFSQKMVDYALSKSNAKNLKFQQGDVTQLGFEDVSLDLIRIERVLHHVPDLEQSFKELHRVLKPGGSLIIAEPDFTMTRLFPLDLKLNAELTQRLSDSIANGDVGSCMHQLALKQGFSIKQRKILHILWDDFAMADTTTQFIQTLRDILQEHNELEAMDKINKAVAEGSYYLAIPMHVIHFMR